MEALVAVLFVVVFIAIIGGSVWLLLRTRRRNRSLREGPGGSQREELAQLAVRHGWEFTPERPGYLKQLTGYPFEHGGDPEMPVYNLVAGTHRGLPFSCFQYAPPRPLQPGEFAAQIQYRRAFVIWLPEPTPAMTLTAGSSPLWTRRYTTGDETFDKAVAVGTEDTEFAERVLTAAVRDWLCRNPPVPGLADASVRFGDGVLAAWYHEKKHFDAATLLPVLEYLHALAERALPQIRR